MKKAFTLIELLVVVAIIASLIAILLPSMGKAREAAKSTVCLTGVRQMQIAHTTFSNANRGSTFQHLSNYTTTKDNPEAFWFGQLAEEMGFGEERTMLCPSAEELYLNPPRGYAGFGDFTHAWGLGDPASTGWTSGYTGSYLYNAWAYNIQKSPILPNNTNRGPGARYWQNVAKFDRPDIIPTFVDGAWCEGWPLHTDTSNGNLYDPYSPWLGIEMSRVTMKRHVGGTNAALADGSARNLRLRELWTLRWHTDFDTTTGYDPE